MIERRKRAVPSKREPGGDYLPRGKALSFIQSGCSVLDCVVGYGWPLGRVVNIVGDRSTGKTLLAIEACANFIRQYPKGKIWYREAEAAFDVDYAKSVGLPASRVDFGPKGIDTQWDTIEDIFIDLDEVLGSTKSEGLYIIDSLDALSSRAELVRKIDDGTFGLDKQKILAGIFRKYIRRVKQSKVCVVFISQTRKRIGARFGDKLTRTGGDSLEFYASIILWLHHLKTIVRKQGSTKRATGVRILAKCKKNKITQPFRDCQFAIRFGFGIDDVEASLEWLEENKMLKHIGLTKNKVQEELDRINELPNDKYREENARLRLAVFEAWREVEASFATSRSKYG